MSTVTNFWRPAAVNIRNFLCFLFVRRILVHDKNLATVIYSLFTLWRLLHYLRVVADTCRLSECSASREYCNRRRIYSPSAFKIYHCSWWSIWKIRADARSVLGVNMASERAMVSAGKLHTQSTSSTCSSLLKVNGCIALLLLFRRLRDCPQLVCSLGKYSVLTF